MTDLDPERFTLRQAAQARDDFAQVIRTGFLQGADRSHPDAQGSGVCPAENNVRQSSVPLLLSFGSRSSGGTACDDCWTALEPSWSRC
jgi:hypothetical protein